MIGATPMIGSADTMLPIGSRPRRRNRKRSARMATAKPDAAAHAVAGEHRLEDRLVDIGGEDRQRVGDARADGRWRRQQDEGHAGAARHRLPEDQDPQPEQDGTSRRSEHAACARAAAPTAASPAAMPRARQRRAGEEAIAGQPSLPAIPAISSQARHGADQASHPCASATKSGIGRAAERAAQDDGS